MSNPELPVLQDKEVRARTSTATLRVLQQRAEPSARELRFLSDDLFLTLQQVVDAILPQGSVGTSVDVADTIDRGLQNGVNVGWRYAELPPHGEAYVHGLTAFRIVLEQASGKTFAAMSSSAREEYLRRAANGQMDDLAQFPLSTWLKVVRADVARAWVSHPQGMHAMQYFGFADGATGNEGWVSIGPDSAMPFEHGATFHDAGGPPAQEDQR